LPSPLDVRELELVVRSQDESRDFDAEEAQCRL
jgi:hypothetical protein